MAGTTGRLRTAGLILAALALLPGCRMVSRDQVEECRQLSQSLRTENAQLKDQVLTLRSQNQDLSERSVDDVRRISQLEEANRLLEGSVQAYQDERSRLESAYKELRASLPGSIRPLAMTQDDSPRPDTPPAPPRLSRSSSDPAASAASMSAAGGDDAEGESHPPGRHGKQGAWVPSRRQANERPIPGRTDP
ncbi:MAG: hypothetical protein U0790_20710 [Isosphaeraceae bacterium]